MRRRAAVLLVALVCAAGDIAASPPPRRLLVEQLGPADASLRPFAIEVGSPAATTRDVVYVTPDALDGALAAARRLDNGAGPFRVTLEDGRKAPIWFSLDRTGVAFLVAPLVQMFQAQGLETPAFLAALAAS